MTKNTKVLIVEDDLFQAQILKLMLIRMNYMVEAVTKTGEEAVELASKLKPDLIFMDISLAGDIDGIEAVRRINEELFSGKIIYVSGNSDHKIRAEKFGYNDFLEKPINKGMLANSLDKVLS